LMSLYFSRQTKKGAIINFGDWAVERPYTDYLPYLVSKGAIPTMTRAFAKELAPGIRVNCIMPGPILLPKDMPAAEKRKAINATLVGHVGSSVNVSQAIAHFIENDFITGVCLNVDGGRKIA